MVRTANLTIHKEEFSFSAGHFTIFSATEREQLHGHNYYVSVEFQFDITHNGLSFDYRDYKSKINELCSSLDRHLLLPSQSSYLTLQDQGDYWHAIYNQKVLPFLKEDVVILPLCNITIEELSRWFLLELIKMSTDREKHSIHNITISVYNGPGQSASISMK